MALHILKKEDFGLGEYDVFVSEHLTPFTSMLAYRCRCLKRRNKILKTKVEKGVVKILTTFDDSVQWCKITHLDDIYRLVEGSFDMFNPNPNDTSE